jgi:hypothetical protein
MIRGSDPKLRDEYVAIGAHNDHIGWSTRPAAHDSMYVVNHLFRTGGADDPPAQLDAARQAQVNALIADIRKRSNGASARPDSIYNGADDDGSCHYSNRPSGFGDAGCGLCDSRVANYGAPRRNIGGKSNDRSPDCSGSRAPADASQGNA